MAKLLSAHHAYGPQLKLKDTVQLNRLAPWISMPTNLNKSTAMMML